MNPDRLRCPQCRTRRTDPHLMVLHVLQCKRPLCHCMGLTYPHRPLSGECHLNPEAQVQRALATAGPEDDPLDLALDVVLSMPGKPMRAWPFDQDEKRKMREAQIEKHLVQRVKALGGEVRKVVWPGRRGAPDRLVMLPPQLRPVAPMCDAVRPAASVWVELKNPDTIRTFPADARERAQAREHKRMRDMGQRVEVIGTIEQVEALLA